MRVLAIVGILALAETGRSGSAEDVSAGGNTAVGGAILAMLLEVDKVAPRSARATSVCWPTPGSHSQQNQSGSPHDMVRDENAELSTGAAGPGALLL